MRREGAHRFSQDGCFVRNDGIDIGPASPRYDKSYGWSRYAWCERQHITVLVRNFRCWWEVGFAKPRSQGLLPVPRYSLTGHGCLREYYAPQEWCVTEKDMFRKDPRWPHADNNNGPAKARLVLTLYATVNNSVAIIVNGLNFGPVFRLTEPEDLGEYFPFVEVWGTTAKILDD
jgi:hypothetical protein